MTLDEYIKNNNKSDKKINKYLKKIIITTILTITTIILCKTNKTVKTYIKKYVYDQNINFSKINNFYNKYILNIKNDIIKPVMGSSSINEWKEYNNGVIKQSETGNDKINAIKSGIVVFVGEKEGYGKTIIIEQIDGIDAWYSNIKDVNVNMYSYVDTNTLLGTYDDKIYLSFWKNGENIDYKNYIK